MQKYIFIDIDGTLLDHNSGIPESAITGIENVRSRGHKVFISTGRARTAVGRPIEAVGFDGYICSGGAYVEVDGVCISNRMMDGGTVSELIAFMKRNEIGFILEGASYSLWDEMVEKHTMAAYDRIHNENPSLAEMLIVPERMRSAEMYCSAKDSVHQITAFSSEIENLKGLECVKEYGLGYMIHDRIYSGLINAEIHLSDVSKASGVDAVLAHFKGSIDQTICYGDSMNDLGMICHCKVGVAMGNAIEALKKSADDVTDTVMNDGILKSFVKYGLC